MSDGIKFRLGGRGSDSVEPFIRMPVTDDGLSGFDEFGQFMVGSRYGDGVSYSPRTDVRQMTCALCGRGWEATSTSLADQIHLSTVHKMAHRSCFERHLALVEAGKVYWSVVDARIRFAPLREIANGYWRESLCPWYVVSLLDHPIDFKIGMRKRVWSIEVQPREGEISWWEHASRRFEMEDGLLVPGFRIRTAKRLDGFVGVFYPDRTGTELPFDTNVAMEIAAGLMNPMGREEYGRDLNRVVYKWGTSHGTTTREHNQGFAYHSADWRCGKATGIAPVVLGRLTDQVLAIRNGPWLFTGDFA